ncbi:dihydropyrimidinase [Nocardioides marmotae]|uniref:dihydropyrimidinase n=1 Tax=Nocardioides marmotae TaxID=2663857 RepID=UPI0012B61DE3|nr:dihydropyrimidinase [Nocardioides marmotae]MBC9732802.1 dihydropyrimidinase [Nocardioides marmotae]MTB83916.1 dihydropyrimidinase [Nocardioides marmotae]
MSIPAGSVEAAGPPVDLIILGGEVVNDGLRHHATVCITGERITHVVLPGGPLPAKHAGTRVIDATDQLVVPGGVDPHTHINMSIGEWTTRDDYASATRAALHGGTTTVVDFAIPVAGERPVDVVRERQQMATEGYCDAALHGCVVTWDATTYDQLVEMADLGVRTIKLFTTYRDVLMASDSTVLRVMEALSQIDGMAVVHAEANHLIEAQEAQLLTSSGLDACHHAQTRTELAELDAVERVLSIAEHLDVPVYFVHQSTEEAVGAVRAARARGVDAYSETCPHYLSLDAGAYKSAAPELFVCCPPLRPRETVDGLRRATLAFDVHTIGSDHCCYSTGQKELLRDDVRAMPAGLPGVETRLPVAYTELVAEGGLPVERFVALVAANPARLNGLYPRKGVIAPGSDADIAVLDVSTPRVVRAQELHMETDYSPYEGRTLLGWPSFVVARGEVVVYEGELTAEPGRGRALEAAPCFSNGRLC